MRTQSSRCLAIWRAPQCHFSTTLCIQRTALAEPRRPGPDPLLGHEIEGRAAALDGCQHSTGSAAGAEPSVTFSADSQRSATSAARCSA